MTGAFEGDLIRPLGLVTLYFGYAESEVDTLLAALAELGHLNAVSRGASLGQKLALARQTLQGIQTGGSASLLSIIEEARPLVELRNVLIHSCILAKGRVVPADKTQPERRITPEQLTELAESIFNWKERLNVCRQRELMPSLRRTSGGST